MGPDAGPGRVLVWSPDGGGWVAPADRGRDPTGPGPLDVADSWLVEDGRVRGLGLHAARFAGACGARRGVPAAAVGAFLDAARAALPAEGRWFPRVECGTDGCLVLRLRPAAADAGPVVLATAAGADPRRAPRVKGPDLPALLALREAAEARGAGEAVLLSPAGHVLEGALSAIVWWRGDVLCVPPAGAAVLDSVTRRLVLALAATRGTPVREEAARPADLGGTELWTLGARHGIRPVTAWPDAGIAPAPPRRAPAWQAMLRAMAHVPGARSTPGRRV